VKNNLKLEIGFYERNRYI